LDVGISAPDEILDIVQLADLEKVEAGVLCHKMPPPGVGVILMPSRIVPDGAIREG
jgi:hypothetical protein